MKEKIKKIIKKSVDKKIAKKAKLVKVVKTKKATPVKPKKVQTKKISLNKIKNKKIKKETKLVTRRKVGKKKEESIKIKKFARNPIIKPSLYSWETKATFNPAAFISDGKVHIVYRAIGDDDNSTLGYAYSYDGLNIEGRPTYSIYKRYFITNENGPKADYMSGGGWSGGCEDPRLTLIDDTIYMIFTAFDGWGSIRLALTSISLDDFKKKKWNWKKAIMISPPNEIHKNWVLFPEKINGKFAILHSLSPKVLIEYFDSLDELDGKKYIKSYYNSKPEWENGVSWENVVRGAGPTPIKTKYGWLVLYHAMDEADRDKYKIGAMILDLRDPTKILYKAKSPILEPEEEYEKEGYRGIIYSCGAVVKDGTLFVYYGGGDKVVCVASIKLETLLKEIIKNNEVKLVKKNKI